MNRNEIYNRVNNIIIEKLKAGVIPWQNPMQGRLPANLISKRFYQGINWLLLSHLNFKSPYFLTFLQAKEKGGHILRGSTGIPVIFWKLMKSTPDENGNCNQFPLIRISTVFNLSQTSLYDDEKERELMSNYPTAENILSVIIENHSPVIDHNFRGQGFYRPSTHSICIPPINQFTNPDSYFDILFHELIHWTAKELKREADHNFGSISYSFEELVAEIGSSYLCSLAGIDRTIDNQTAYIQSWLKKLEDDNTLIIKASAQAKKAVNYLLKNAEENAAD